MRKLSTPPASLLHLPRWRNPLPTAHRFLVAEDNRQAAPRRNLAQVRAEPLGELWFTSNAPRRSPADDILSQTNPPESNNDHTPPDERTLKLGKTLRVLSPLLPNILTNPLPQDVLSPSITLHLFPSTHPHLPVVKGRVPYRAALWTAPVAWGCVPIVGNTKLRILSEKIVRTGYLSTPQSDSCNGLGEEKLVVRWKTESRKTSGQPTPNPTAHSTTTASTNNSSLGINRGLSSLLGGDRPLFPSSNTDFTGLFVFSFDAEGRIVSHTIEHADENNGLDKTSKVVTLTDWLLGKARGRKDEEEALLPGLAIVRAEWKRERSDRLW